MPKKNKKKSMFEQQQEDVDKMFWQWYFDLIPLGDRRKMIDQIQLLFAKILADHHVRKDANRPNPT